MNYNDTIGAKLKKNEKTIKKACQVFSDIDQQFSKISTPLDIYNELCSIMHLFDAMIQHPNIETHVIYQTMPLQENYPSSPIIEEIIDEDPKFINDWIVNKIGNFQIGILNDAKLEDIIKSTLVNITYVKQ
ncbi:hypothetical protein Indivirus_2_89 [Indivirus ILV1]|uniref:Uncharacterized protein n=1 Tax=Indivirus ILV1 TaxID=1977633 RepID=A0A1V0SDB1_9VIRU|nr:hypothetical protein Indivirus_2_89 [Indivirus ILV1]